MILDFLMGTSLTIDGNNIKHTDSLQTVNTRLGIVYSPASHYCDRYNKLIMKGIVKPCKAMKYFTLFRYYRLGFIAMKVVQIQKSRRFTVC